MSYIPRRRQVTSPMCRGYHGVQTAPAACPEPRSSEQSQSSHLGPEPAPILTCIGQVSRHRPGRAPSSEKTRKLVLLEDASGLSQLHSGLQDTYSSGPPLTTQAVCSNCLAESSCYLGHRESILPEAIKFAEWRRGRGS